MDGNILAKKAGMVVIFIAVIAAILFIALKSPISPNASPKFSSSVAESFDEKKVLTMKREKLSVTMRIADIRTVNPENGASYTSIVYDDATSPKKIYADFIIENKTGVMFFLTSSNSGGIYLGYDFDTNDEPTSEGDQNNKMAFCRLLDEKGEAKDTYSITVNNGEKKEFRVETELPANYVNKVNTLYFSGEAVEDGPETEYSVAGIGVPFMIFRFKNETFFPEITKADQNVISSISVKNTTETAVINTDSFKYPLQKVNSTNSMVSDINKKASGLYEFSAEIRAEGNVENCMSVVESQYSADMSNSSYIGVIPEIVYDSDKEVELVTVYFKINPSLKNNQVGVYTGSEDFKGINRLSVVVYDEKSHTAMPIETFRDESKNLIYATYDRAGTFALADMEKWYNMLGVNPNEVKN